MAVRSKRLFGPAAITTTGGVVYTVPSGRTALVKGLFLGNTHATESTRAYININGLAAGTRLYEVELAPHQFVSLVTEFVLEPGDTFQAKKDATGSFVVSGHGSLLLGAPS